MSSLSSARNAAECSRPTGMAGEKGFARTNAGWHGTTSIPTNRTGKIQAENVSVRNAEKNSSRHGNMENCASTAAQPAQTGRGKRRKRNESIHNHGSCLPDDFYLVHIETEVPIQYVQDMPVFRKVSVGKEVSSEYCDIPALLLRN